MTIKNPEAPATDKQLNWLKALAAEKGHELNEAALATMTKGEASEKIDLLLQAPKITEPAPSLMAMAAAIEGTPIEDEAQVPVHPAIAALESDHTLAAEHKLATTLAITVEQANTLLSWFPIVAAETDPTIDDLALEATLQAFVNPADGKLSI